MLLAFQVSFQLSFLYWIQEEYLPEQLAAVKMHGVFFVFGFSRRCIMEGASGNTGQEFPFPENFESFVCGNPFFSVYSCCFERVLRDLHGLCKLPHLVFGVPEFPEYLFSFFCHFNCHFRLLFCLCHTTCVFLRYIAAQAVSVRLALNHTLSVS